MDLKVPGVCMFFLVLTFFLLPRYDILTLPLVDFCDLLLSLPVSFPLSISIHRARYLVFLSRVVDFLRIRFFSEYQKNST